MLDDWLVERYKGFWLVCDRPLAVHGASCLGSFPLPQLAEDFLKAYREWAAQEPNPADFGGGKPFRNHAQQCGLSHDHDAHWWFDGDHDPEDHWCPGRKEKEN